MPSCRDRRASLREFFRRGAVGTGKDEETTVDDQGFSGGTPTSRITSTGYSETAAGLPSRFISCDQAEPIGYLIDIIPSLLPTGISQAEAVAAVQECLSAWAENTSLTFRYDGLTSFGQAANTITTSDRRIRLQLHDNYGNQITSSSTLGIGGGSFSNNPPPRDAAGGVVDGQPFTERLRGYIVLNHPSLANFNLDDFKEIISHEIGHSLGLVHSSEDANEPVFGLEDATMYYRVHKDGRGSAIRGYDSSHIQVAYPENDTPPFAADRLLRVVTSSSTAIGVGVDRVEITGGDLQGNTVTLEHMSSYDSNLNGSFSTIGKQLVFNPDGAYGDGLLSDAQIANGTFYDRCYFRLSDGTNQSPPYTFRIIGFHFDSSPSDGLPNSWMTNNFGTTSPGAPGSDRHPDSDPDGDGIDNRTERYLGTDPNDSASGPPPLSFDPVLGTISIIPTRFATYRYQSSTDLENWSSDRIFTQLDAPTSLSFDAPQPEADGRFYRFVFGP